MSAIPKEFTYDTKYERYCDNCHWLGLSLGGVPMSCAESPVPAAMGGRPQVAVHNATDTIYLNQACSRWRQCDD